VVSILALTAAGCLGGNGDRAGTTGERAAAEQVITINWANEPLSLDPGLARDRTSANILLNVMDPLVKLGDDLEPRANLAESWEVSEDGKTVTFTLRSDGKWTNGDRVTAADFEWSWKRVISPDLAAEYAYQFFAIVGAEDLNRCEQNCKALEDEVGVKAVDERTLEIKLTNARPWFVQQVAHHSFLAVHRATVERFGERWTEASTIVTNGPFRLARWEHDSAIDLVKWGQWRDAGEVELTRVNGRMISDGTAAVRAFEAGEIDVATGLPPAVIGRLGETDDYQQYAGLGTYYYGVNVENVPDVNQRRAMALAIDRRQIVDDITQTGEMPATGFTPSGMPGFDAINPNSPWMPESGDLARARKLMGKVENPRTRITLLLHDWPGHREIAVAVQSAWKKLGLHVTIEEREWARFLELIGPPPDPSIDVHALGWIGDYVDAMNFLELWTCRSGHNGTNFCNRRYDSLVARARRTENNQVRFELYGRLEQILHGRNGQMPVLPLYWFTYVQLERPSIQETLNLNPLDQLDLTQVEVRA
jgi:ABC-type oligopeptide transport system substrate-binding subunit